MKMKNLKNKQIIKINALKFKKTLRMTTSRKQTNDQIKFRFITQKRMLSTHSTDTEIFDKLNINVKSILNDPKRNAYIKGYLDTLLILNNDLEYILTDDTISLWEKQRNLGKLSQKSQSFEMELRYNVPKKLSELINTLDSILLKSDNLQNEDVSPYLSSVLAEKLGGHSNLKRSYKTNNLVQTITILKDILRVFNYMSNSFGLFLVYNLVSLLRFGFNNVKLKKK